MAVRSHQVFDDLLNLGLSLLHLLRRPLQTDPLLAVRKFDVNLRKHTHTHGSGLPAPPPQVTFISGLFSPAAAAA